MPTSRVELPAHGIRLNGCTPAERAVRFRRYVGCLVTLYVTGPGCRIADSSAVRGELLAVASPFAGSLAEQVIIRTAGGEDYAVSGATVAYFLPYIEQVAL